MMKVWFAYPIHGTKKYVLNASVSSVAHPSVHNTSRTTAALKLHDVSSYCYSRIFFIDFKKENDTNNFINIIKEFQDARAAYLEANPIETGEEFHPTDSGVDADSDTESDHTEADLHLYCPVCKHYGNDAICFCKDEGTRHVQIDKANEDEISLKDSFEEPMTQDFPHVPLYPFEDDSDN